MKTKMTEEMWAQLETGIRSLGLVLTTLPQGGLRVLLDQDKLAAALSMIPPTTLEQFIGMFRVFDTLPPQVVCCDGFSILDESQLQLRCPCGQVSVASLKPGNPPSMSCPACDRVTTILVRVADQENPQEIWIRRSINLVTRLTRSSHESVKSLLKRLGGHLTDEAVVALRAGRVGRS